MKARSQVEQLLTQFKHNVAEVAANSEDTEIELNQAAVEDGISASNEVKANPSNAKDRGSLKKREQSAWRKGKERVRSSGHDRNAQDSGEGNQQNLELLVDEGKPRVNRRKRKDQQQEPPPRVESRTPGSSHGALKASSEST